MMKPWLRTLHKWVGLILGIFWFLQAMTGALLVFHWEMEGLSINQINPAAPVHANTQKLDIAIHAVEEAYGTPALFILNSGSGSNQFDIISEVSAQKYRATLVSAQHGTILRSRLWSGPISELGFWRLTFLFHRELLSGPVGHWIVGFSGIFLFSTLVAGLIIGWPLKGTWGHILKPKKFRWVLASCYAWHRALGLWVSPIALILAFTGILMVWNIPLKKITNTIIPNPIIETTLSNKENIPVSKALQIAQAQFPLSTPAMIDLPQGNKPYYSVRLTQPHESRRLYGTTTVFINSHDGSILKIYNPKEAPLRFKAFDALYPVHTGEFFGLLGRILYQATAIGIMALILAGWALWVFKRKRNARKK